MADPPDPYRLLRLAIDVVSGAAAVAHQMRSVAVTAVDTKSSATDVVTAGDRATERYALQALRAARPHDAVLGEELGETRPSDSVREKGLAGSGAGTVRWILDPIDGTVNYLYGLPHYAISLAAEVDGEVLVGVVRNVANGEQWTAIRGRGAYRAGNRLSGSAADDLGQSLVATGFGYVAGRRAHQARVLSGLLPAVRDIRRFGAASLDLCFAAEGRVDAYFEKGLAVWDHAAGGLIAAEAGMRVTGLSGRPPGPDLVLAAPVGIYQQLHDLLVTLDADGGA
jgi:myo-inositol-1(or 4)-monophosphatase